MCTQADSATDELEPEGEHGVLHASTSAHDNTTAHDSAHDTTVHDTATATATKTPVRWHDNYDSTINGLPESTVQRDEGRAHGTQLLTERGG